MRILLVLAILLGGCAASPHGQPPASPLDGRIWDTRSRAFISPESAHERAAGSRYVMLGEIHDNPVHHQLQLAVLRALDARGRKPAVVMEQLDAGNQDALARAQASGVLDAEQLADAGRMDRKGWGWPMYRDLIAFAAERRWPLVAANLSRSEARDIALGKITPPLPPAEPALQAALEEAMVRGHCGHRPPAQLLARLVTAQRARDAQLARALQSADTQAVLIAGAGHVHREHAVPKYLEDGGQALVIAFVETDAARARPQDYALAGYDLAWFTPPTPREDPCATPLTGIVAPARP